MLCYVEEHRKKMGVYRGYSSTFMLYTWSLQVWARNPSASFLETQNFQLPLQPLPGMCLSLLSGTNFYTCHYSKHGVNRVLNLN